MSDSDSSSALSPSPPASPDASFHDPPNLERLVSHFVSAKRSLNSTAHVSRANELVTSSRALIEDIAVLNAKCAFARRGVDDELDALRSIRDGISALGQKAGDEFKMTLASLDEANDRLQKTLQAMRKTVVDPALQPGNNSPPNEDQAPEDKSLASSVKTEKTLYDFIDEANHEEILGSLRALIDSFNDAHADLDDSLASFDQTLRSISDNLLNGLDRSGPDNRSTIYDEPPLSITQLFQGMEEHAGEMANLLQSLITHYDLSVTALKHTDGGGEAAKLAVQAEDLTRVPTAGAEESLYERTVPEPMSDDERTEMLCVLENDANEVDDVINDIQERAAEMEVCYTALAKHATTARTTRQNLCTALKHLYAMQSSLPTYLTASKTFRESWITIEENMQARTAELIHLSDFHSNFVSSYSKLLDEVARRKAADVQMRKVAEKARREMDRLYEADREAREAFMQNVGEFLPGDIWAGLQEVGGRWTVRRVGGD
ncbi:Hypothetical protein R9X50_00800700 [Acrodontium crateriforme]|uniref:Autophagy-related protein 17 n=1 Tax=Acrodontium crateriforme TaxID=150365 RepID=A0AAQ3R875_9PEZI|nr:Hypothetical protein R9X50_00800700 [Acrodontium crateriforme]